MLLKPKEKEIIDLLRQGLTYKEIGQKLFLSPRTVERITGDLREATDCLNNTHLVNYAWENNIIPDFTNRSIKVDGPKQFK